MSDQPSNGTSGTSGKSAANPTTWKPVEVSGQAPVTAESGAAPGSRREEEETDGMTGRVPEVGGRDGPDPTRYGDWEYKGRCIDF